MDHLLDFIFMCSILIGYALLFDGPYRNIFLILVPIFGAFIINSYLSFAATNEFKFTFLGMGPTEVRLLVIIFGTGFPERKSHFYLCPLTPLQGGACGALAGQ